MNVTEFMRREKNKINHMKRELLIQNKKIILLHEFSRMMNIWPSKLLHFKEKPLNTMPKIIEQKCNNNLPPFFWFYRMHTERLPTICWSIAFEQICIIQSCCWKFYPTFIHSDSFIQMKSWKYMKQATQLY